MEPGDDANSIACRLACGATVSPRGLRVIVIGLGRFGGGVSVTRWLANEGARVTVVDRAPAAALLASVRAVRHLDVRLLLGYEDVAVLDDTDLVVVNPAVDKARSELFRAIRQREIPWCTEINLFCPRCRAPVIAVTGTFGKSTTAAMLADALAAGIRADRRVYLAGNIGKSLLPQLDVIRPHDIVVLELSSAQTEDLPRIDWHPALVVLTNLWPHHIDRYPRFEDYVSAKLALLPTSSESPPVITGPMHTIAEQLVSRRLQGVSRHRIRLESVSRRLRIRGIHNQWNAAAAAEAACKVFDADPAAVEEALERFRGLPHRFELIGEVDNVRFINDSKSTAPDTTVAAVQAAGDPVVLIVGGGAHEPTDLAGTARAIRPFCRGVVCMGESGPAWAEALRKEGAIVVPAGSMAEAVATSQKIAHAGDVVLFSPGHPSFDAYANFAERGDHFRRTVNALA